MGKDTAKVLLHNIHKRTHVPYYVENATTELNRKASSRFGLLRNDLELKVTMAEDIEQLISRLEEAQIEKLNQFKEEDAVEDDTIIRQASTLQLFAFDTPTTDDAQDDQSLSYTEFTIPDCDLALYTLSDSIESTHIPSLQSYVALKKEAEGYSVAVKPPSPLSAAHKNVVPLYKDIGKIFACPELSSVMRIHKAVKIIPSLQNWDEILLLTEPSKWSPRAAFEVTKVFLTHVKATQLKCYLQYVLLYLVRTNISQKGQLDFYLENAIKKSLESTPGLFIKGFLIPLLMSNSCTLKEALAIGRILRYTHMSASHSSAALLCLTEQRSNTLPLHVLIWAVLLKRPTLDYRAINALVARYFGSSSPIVDTTITPPMIWYHSLYIFVESYHIDMVSIHKQKLLKSIAMIQQNDVSKRIEELIYSTTSLTEQPNLKVNHDAFSGSPSSLAQSLNDLRRNNGSSSSHFEDANAFSYASMTSGKCYLSDDSAIISYSQEGDDNNEPSLGPSSYADSASSMGISMSVERDLDISAPNSMMID